MRFLFPLFLLWSSLSSGANNDDLLAQIVARARATGSDSLVIRQHGRVIYSDFFGQADRARNVQSVTKSIVGLALAILRDEGRLASYDLPMSIWIPSWVNHPVKSKITLRMVMNHTSGLPTLTDGLFEAKDVLERASQADLVGVPGAQHLYSNVGVMLLQMVIAQSSGRSVADFVNEKIFHPLKIFDASWRRDSIGHEMTSGGLFLSTVDLVKIGEMLLSRGRFENVQVVSEPRFQELIEKSQTYFDYGLLFWLSRPVGATGAYDIFSAVGWGGQFVTIYPAKGLVAIRTRDPATTDPEQIDELYFRDFRDLVARWE